MPRTQNYGQAPLEGWRHVKVTDRHTAVDYAQVLKDLSDTHYPNVSKIVLVQDNLNTHKPASLYEAFPAAEARRLVERFEWHYTPKHGSWLDMAESELSVVSCQCLDRRIADKQTLIKEVSAWEQARNKHHAKADWQLTNPLIFYPHIWHEYGVVPYSMLSAVGFEVCRGQSGSLAWEPPEGHSRLYRRPVWA
jgi:hypothetical protein